MGVKERVLGMPVSLSPLHKSIKEFDRAVLKVDSELKVSCSSDCCLLLFVHSFIFELSISYFP